MNISTLAPTRYEITATHPDGRCLLIGYTARKSRFGLLNLMRQHSGKIIQTLNIGEHDMVHFATKPRVHCTMGEWTIGFTGRTQRDVRSAGHEHQWIAA